MTTAGPAGHRCGCWTSRGACVWTRWEFDWRPDRAGQREILVRCLDDRGRIQPLTRDPDRGTYLINEVTPYPVTVR